MTRFQVRGLPHSIGTLWMGLLNGVMPRSSVDTLSELCSPFLKGGNSTFIPAIASGLFPKNEYRSLE